MQAEDPHGACVLHALVWEPSANEHYMQWHEPLRCWVPQGRGHTGDGCHTGEVHVGRDVWRYGDEGPASLKEVNGMVVTMMVTMVVDHQWRPRAWW